MASSLRLRLPPNPMMAPPPPLKNKKRKKKRDGAALAGVGLTEEDMLLGLMDEMGAAIKGGVCGVDGDVGSAGPRLCDYYDRSMCVSGWFDP